jgi:hypothetical protein
VALATANVTSTTAEAAKFDKIERAISGEIDKLQITVRTLTHNVYAAMADLIVASDEYAMLRQQHADAWLRLRSVKTALRAVSSGLHGYMPQNLADIAYLSEPMEERVGYPVERDLVNGWAAALAQLADDADQELPLFG